eukprot:CAMPEP_0116148030 /NCGR_PEP_ID=MMETSP0329-20121206/18105_1 /TAXON_ID=697910 /ORGANISM="Pseudo-nitzschia arenysensis, Strain B593" /LENGTH=179 /DNA_ID=CAMNT_0003644067 /DNA_START=272 /DNA_END=811 /DNA_ORIENTATION=+
MGIESNSYELRQSDIISFFGCPMVVVAKLWDLIIENNDWDESAMSKKEHLLWALHYMKQSPNTNVMRKTFQKVGRNPPCKKTVLKWVWFYVNQISELEEKVIVWERRKTNDVGDDCLVSVDCIDCQFQQVKMDHPTRPGQKTIDKTLNSFKFKGPGLRYEVALSEGQMEFHFPCTFWLQ